MSSSGGVRVPVGTCQICGVEDVMRARCERCYKGACGKPDCLKIIQDKRLCHVPISA